MGLNRDKTITLNFLQIEGVTASGEYTLSELQQSAVTMRSLAAEQLNALRDVQRLFGTSELDVSGETAEDRASFNAGNKVALKVLSVALRTAVRKLNKYSPQTTRETYLTSLLSDFDDLAVETPGLLSLEASGMNPVLFDSFDRDDDGLITRSDLQSGIAS